jgi:hypothetical protein
MKLIGLHFVNVAEIQEAVTDELQKVQKEEFSAAFQKLYDCAEVCIYANGAHFEYKKKRYVSSIFKKIISKTFGPHCVGKSFFVLPSHTTKTHPIEGRRKLT